MNRRRKTILIAALGLGMVLFGNGMYLQAKAMLAQYLLQDAWEQTLQGEGQVKPWPWADTWPVARLQVPMHEIDLIVLSGASGRTLAFAPGHLDGTPLPGDTGYSIVSAHRDTHFAFLGELREREQIKVQRPDGKSLVYEVVEYGVVNANRASFAVQEEQEGIVLLTCYPFQSLHAGSDLRYYVIAKRVLSPPISGMDV